MRESTRNFVVGLTALGGCIGLALLLTLFGAVPKFFEDNYRIRVVMPNAAGVNSSSRVRLNGIDIGRVEAVRLKPRPQDGVVFDLTIQEDIRIPENAQVSVHSPLLGGSPSLSFWTPQERADGFLPTDGSAVVEGQPAPSLANAAADIKNVLRESVDKFREDIRRAVDRFEAVSRDFHALSQEWTRVGQNVNDLIERRPPEKIESGEAAANLSTVILRADQRLTELQDTLKAFNDLVGDPKLREDLHATLANARDASRNIRDVSADARQVVANTDKRIDELSRRLIAVADDMSGTIKTLQDAVKKASEGQGTAAKLLNDPSVYNNLDDTIQRIGLAVDDLRLLIQKWKAEGVQVNF